MLPTVAKAVVTMDDVPTVAVIGERERDRATIGEGEAAGAQWPTRILGAVDETRRAGKGPKSPPAGKPEGTRLVRPVRRIFQE